MKKLLKSRKFLILVLDAVFGLAALFAAFFLVEGTELKVLILAVFGILQPVFVGVINGITQEDAAAYAANIHPNQKGSVHFVHPQPEEE